MRGCIGLSKAFNFYRLPRGFGLPGLAPLSVGCYLVWYVGYLNWKKGSVFACLLACLLALVRPVATFAISRSCLLALEEPFR